ncbi:MAG: FAD-dependent oxidoreductase, partial [Desulfuromonadales bacterium]|nr:FAD-dependent oxidoreductase [Desulfuromonadales bacterium]
GEIEQEKLLIHPEAWYQENQIDLYLDAEIQAINRDERRLKLKNDRDLEYDRLILALGAHPFVPPIPGSNRENIMTLRTRTDAENILKKVQDGLNCVVVGGGVLGLETAAALARLGCNVTAMEGFDWLLPRQLNRAAGEKLCAFVEALGIKVITGARIKQFDGDERVCSVVLATEESFDSDLVLIAAGVRSNTYLARLAGLEVNDGVVVNNSLQTSDPDIFAVGDVSEHQGVSYGTWAPAQFQGSIAGMNASGDSVSFAGIPRSNMLKVLGVELFSIGNVHPDDASYQTYELDEKGRYAYFVFRDTHLIGAILLGDTALSAYLKQLIESQLSCAEILSKSKSAKELYDALLQRS